MLLSHSLIALVAYSFAAFLPRHAQLWFVSALLAVICSSLAPFIVRRASKSAEAYDLDHAVLNTQRPQTMWLNMGLWEDTTSFPVACEALARRLGEFAGLQPGEAILETGYGCGESIPFWSRHFHPSRIVGVTSLEAHRRIAEETVSTSEHIPMETTIELHSGDAVAWTKEACSRLSEGEERFDRVLALDCAYHFKDRRAFLHNAHDLLNFTGTLGLTELMLPEQQLSLWSKFCLRGICLLAKVPYENLISRQAYIAQLEEIGYSGIELEVITQHVFAGLAAYIDGIDKDVRLANALDRSKVRQYVGFAKVLRWWAAGPKLDFVLVKAMRGGPVKRKQ